MQKQLTYTKPSDAQLAHFNQNKVLEELVLRQIERLVAEDPELDMRWLAIARTQIEQGFMALNRAVMRPERLKELDLELMAVVMPQQEG